VLELGCGDGGNALSIAASLPGAEVVGVDAAASAVARGSALAGAAGLRNVSLRVGDFESVAAGGDLGSFDYVVAHGVYSWVPPAARVALLAATADCLASAGIAFLSYNAYPGSYLRDMARDVLRYHLHDVEDPQARLAGAHELMRTIVAIEEPSPYARVLREQLERMLQYSEALLFHDDLADVSTPFYLHEVIEHAERHGLRFLAEADLHESLMRDVPDGAVALMEGLPDEAVVREQYLDFFKNRMFRQTLLCRAEVPVRRALDDGALTRLAISSAARSEGMTLDGAETFATPEGYSMTTSEPLVLGAMAALAAAAPGAVAFADLAVAACAAAGPDAPAELVEARLREVLLEASLARVVILHGCAPPVAARAGERPLASPLVRAQAAAGAPVVSSLLHTNVRVGEGLDAALLPLLDGTRDRAALRAAVGAQAASLAEIEAALVQLAANGLLRDGVAPLP
jgi:methyltransferase-like protein/trans-aconitate methyltransferase